MWEAAACSTLATADDNAVSLQQACLPAFFCRLRFDFQSSVLSLLATGDVTLGIRAQTPYTKDYAWGSLWFYKNSLLVSFI